MVSALVMLVALWAGSYVLAFFGIGLPALRCAGGVVLAIYAWSSLNAPERREARKTEQIEAAAGRTTRRSIPSPRRSPPGAARLPAGSALLPFFIGMSAAALLVAALVWLLYGASDHISRVFGQVASRAITRLSAFFQLCIGVQILITGVTEALHPLLVR